MLKKQNPFIITEIDVQLSMLTQTSLEFRVSDYPNIQYVVIFKNEQSLTK